MAGVWGWLRRRDGLQQILLVIGALEIYEICRHFIDPNWPAAMANAQRVLDLERWAGFAWEQSLQRAFLEVPELVRAMNVFYFVGHFILTGLFFLWLYFRSRDGFRSFRNGFLVATAISLVIHWKFPTAPPRLAGGEIGVQIQDTLRVLSNIDIGSQKTSSYSNPVAAVPSLHAGWAVGVAIGVWRYVRSRPVRLLAMLYPIAVMLTIVVTGNHFLFDAVAGVLVMAIGFMVSWWLVDRRRPRDDEHESGAILAAATRGGAVR
jgi:membrane-associated phospholipid phosphatase